MSSPQRRGVSAVHGRTFRQGGLFHCPECLLPPQRWQVCARPGAEVSVCYLHGGRAPATTREGCSGFWDVFYRDKNTRIHGITPSSRLAGWKGTCGDRLVLLEQGHPGWGAQGGAQAGSNLSREEMTSRSSFLGLMVEEALAADGNFVIGSHVI